LAQLRSNCTHDLDREGLSALSAAENVKTLNRVCLDLEQTAERLQRSIDTIKWVVEHTDPPAEPSADQRRAATTI